MATTLSFRHSAVIAIGGLLLASCSQGSGSSTLPGAAAPAARQPAHRAAPDAAGYRLLYQFSGGSGADPDSGLLAMNHKLYGTAEQGGAGDGVVFSITPEGAESTVLEFSGSDGSGPNAGLTNVYGTIYGTTKTGGAHDHGTVFSINNGSEKVIYSFKGGTDGQQPHSTLLYHNGLLYGTTYAGGAYASGTAYEVNAGGAEEVLYAFGKSYLDGGEPNTGFTVIGNKLYSATYGGGAYRRGIAYSLTTQGKERVLHSFGNEYDGSHPYNAALLAANGVFYGTTCAGGQYNLGTVYMMSPSGEERVIYSFGKTAYDPTCPTDGLVLLHGVMYGTSYSGGATGSGTIFSVTYGGNVTVLHSFNASGDGALPGAPLTLLNGVFFGTTTSGGTGKGYGVIFRYKP
ncbi:MAG TPA: choice-of-anchor tandem repeat GloVer-containing protein [Candidatus Cybelea sp.]|jgi:uncharacterized repeat protein (TIGR03803 family)|nr:choice-of-anchor tandem repeat GloVer-containing protein [Candidatus Cybelea sp.]